MFIRVVETGDWSLGWVAGLVGRYVDLILCFWDVCLLSSLWGDTSCSTGAFFTVTLESCIRDFSGIVEFVVNFLS